MTKLFRVLALSALLAGAATVNVTSAQDKGKPGKTDDDKKPARKSKKGLVQITESAKNGKFYLSIRDGEGKFLAQGGPSGYESKDDALKALEAIKAAVEDPRVEYPAKKAEEKDDDKTDKKEPKKKKG